MAGFTVAAPLYRKPLGNETEAAFQVTGDAASYLAGGLPYLPTDFGFAKINYLETVEVNVGNFIVRHDRANKKFVVAATATGAEVANATNLTGLTFTAVIRGKSTKGNTA